MRKMKYGFAISLCTAFLLCGGPQARAQEAGDGMEPAQEGQPDAAWQITGGIGQPQSDADGAWSGYEIYVNRAANCVTVMGIDGEGNLKPVRAMICSCGRQGHETPKGTFATSDYYDWRMMVDDTYGRYAVRFNNKILFHSVPYLTPSPDALEWEQYNLLGEGASLGCVRLAAADAKWIYDNCGRGTKVVVYDDAEDPGPLGKPEILRIDGASPYRFWDPTDADAENPALFELEDGENYADFDSDGYAGRYPDVALAYGTQKWELWKHYIRQGKAEGRVAFP